MTIVRPGAAKPARWLLLAAFAAIYLVWGSSYIAIHFAVQTVPPFVLGGFRFAIAGLIMMVWARAQGAPMPTLRHWRSAIIAGLLLFLINNGSLIWSSQYLPSGLIALLVGATPMWVVLLNWLHPGGQKKRGKRPSLSVISGLVLGFVGIFLLVNPGDVAAGGPNFALGLVLVLAGGIAWAAGSVYTCQAPLPESPIMSTGMQLLTGGLLLLVLASVTGEFAHFDLAAVPPMTFVAWAHLIVMGSIIGFGSYVWLLRVADPARVAAYAYVNPLVAVVLGWALANEAITLRTILATAIIIGGVMLINGVFSYRRSLPRLRTVVEPVAESV